MPFEDGIEVFRLIGSFFRTDKFCLYDVLNQRFKGLPVLFVHGEQKAGQHNEDHHERRNACASAAFEQKEKRQSNKECRRKEDELSPLAMMMYDDFIRRVHKHRTNPNLSRQIQKCVDYIEMNLDKKIVAEDLAALVGYTEYYLTHKFKEETGLSVTNYVKFAKVERAKVLLKSTPFSVREISEQLGFATRNYFSAVFQQVTGKTPMEFRET